MISAPFAAPTLECEMHFAVQAELTISSHGREIVSHACDFMLEAHQALKTFHEPLSLARTHISGCSKKPPKEAPPPPKKRPTIKYVNEAKWSKNNCIRQCTHAYKHAHLSETQNIFSIHFSIFRYCVRLATRALQCTHTACATASPQSGSRISGFVRETRLEAFRIFAFFFACVRVCACCLQLRLLLT